MVHEGNKDEAENCFNIAQKYFREGNRDKSLRMAQKADRLFPLEQYKEFIELLNRLGSGSNGSTGTSSSSTNHMGSQENLRQRHTSGEGTPTSTTADYTPDQLDAVRKIKSCKDYYDILGVSKEATDSDLKKTYRKLALQFHPDKNKAPGATEAFKAVGNSFAVLSDPEKRKHYDQYGLDDPHTHSGRSSHYESSSNDGDVTAEEIFNMFFGGGYPGSNVYVRRNGRWERPGSSHSSHTRTQRHAHNSNQQDQSGLSVVLQLMPLLLILLSSLVSSFLSSDPLYSLSPTNKYPVQRTTRNLAVNFFVKQDFNTEFQGNLRQLERSVEEDYIATLRNACYKERNYKENMIWRAKSFGDAHLYRKANELKTPSCDSLHDLYNN